MSLKLDKAGAAVGASKNIRYKVMKKYEHMYNEQKIHKIKRSLEGTPRYVIWDKTHAPSQDY
jgi:hypothetical protein